MTSLVRETRAQNELKDTAGEKLPPVLHFVPRSGEMLEIAVFSTIRSAREVPPDAGHLIPEMVALYRELAVIDTLPRHKRESYQEKLEYYMVDLGLFVI
ncbi:MAG: hypothetical protein MPJ50_19700 [Pirellulales bacterium]|nr:hypothetical protein [Pirellulales bacterium]